MDLLQYYRGSDLARPHKDPHTRRAWFSPPPTPDHTLDTLRSAVGRVWLGDEAVGLIATRVETWWTWLLQVRGFQRWSRPVDRVQYLIVNDGGPRFPEWNSELLPHGAQGNTVDDLLACRVYYRQKRTEHRIEWLPPEEGASAWAAWAQDPSSTSAYEEWQEWNAGYYGALWELSEE